MAAQIRKVKNSVGCDFFLRVDSHLHYHLIPFVFDALLDLNEEFKFSYIRVPEEPFIFCFENMECARKYFSSNVIKHFLLNFLGKRYKVRLSGLGIKSSDYFIGVLFSGNLSQAVVKSAITGLPAGREDVTVEILLHPGGAAEKEKIIFESNKLLEKHYYSQYRQRERELIKSSVFREFLDALKKDKI